MDTILTIPVRRRAMEWWIMGAAKMNLVNVWPLKTMARKMINGRQPDSHGSTSSGLDPT